MRLRLVALGCTLAGALGFVALPPTVAQAAGPAKVKPGLSISTLAGGYPYGDKVKLTVTLGKTAGSRVVLVYAQPSGRPRTLVQRGKVNGKGKLYPAYRITRTTRFTVVYPGDARDSPATASRTVTAAAPVTAAIAGYYQTTKISGVSYRLFRAKSMLTLRATVTPGKPGECLEPETEQFDPGSGWNADTKYGCDKLGAKSSDSAPFSLRQAVGDRYRIRADYVPGARNTANVSGHSGWLYFAVVR